MLRHAQPTIPSVLGMLGMVGEEVGLAGWRAMGERAVGRWSGGAVGDGRWSGGAVVVVDPTKLGVVVASLHELIVLSTKLPPSLASASGGHSGLKPNTIRMPCTLSHGAAANGAREASNEAHRM